MLIDFNQKEEITIPGMNNGTGTMSAKMYIDEQGKIIPSVIETKTIDVLKKSVKWISKKYV